MTHNKGPARLNETTDYILYSSNINCTDKKLDPYLAPACSNLTFLHGTEIEELIGYGSLLKLLSSEKTFGCTYLNDKGT